MKSLSFINVNKKLQLTGFFEKIYSKFDFLYLQLTTVDQNGNLNEVENYLFNYLKDFKFITYQISDTKQSFQEIKNTQKEVSNDSSKKNNIIVICVEGKCHIIERIDFLMINKIITKLKEQPQTAIINTSKSSEKIKQEDEIEANEEIDGFIEYFRNTIQNNQFINYTVRPIAGFLIRRYFYPTNYFKEPSFFTFKNSKENEKKTNLIQILNSKESSQFCYNFNQLVKNEKENQNKENNMFKYDEFIELRTLFGSTKAVFNLVIHIETLHIFMMKKVQLFQDNAKELDHETYFCKNFSHHCLTKFYGFVEINKKTKGFIYEYLSNGSLQSFVKKHSKNFDDLYKLLTINRLYQGIEYLHSNSLIHRDIKPSNILLDHDFIPYISDFDEIRHINTNETMTIDLGSIFYTSPEQDRGEKLTSSTDIYSFGKIIYYLYVKKNDSTQNKSIIKQISKNITISQNINNLYQSCCQYEPEKRIKHQNIKSIIIDEINSFSYLEQYLINETNNFYSMIVIQYLLENLYIERDLTLFNIDIINIRRLFFIKNNDDYSLFYLSLGIFYCNGFYAKQNYSKAIYYFELAAMEKNSDAFLYLGIIYYKGLGVKQDDSKVLQYFKQSANLNNSEALYYLGILNLKGIIVKQDYLKARNYFELLSKQNDSRAFLFLGIIYYYGYGVVQDYLKSIEYFELAANLNNSNAQTYLSKLDEKGFKIKQDYLIKNDKFEEEYNKKLSKIRFQLGIQYENKNGDHHDYLKAKEYYELAANQNNSEALFNLGNLYYNGFGVKQNYMKAIEYFELAIKQNNPDAFYYLGIIYMNGYNVEKDYMKAIEYFEKAININNSKACLSLDIQINEEFGIEQEGLATTEYNGFSSNQNNSNFEIEQEGLATTENMTDSIINLGQGLIYLFGYEGEKDYIKAKEYLELAANQNNPNAYFYLGNIYMNGYGVVEKDYSKAIKYYEFAAENNNPDAIYNLGIVYFSGLGVKQDYTKARKYFELLEKQNNSKVLVNLGVIYYYGYGVDRDCMKAIKYFELAAKKNDLVAFHNLGVIYSYGFGVARDYLKAIKYFEIASKQNYSDSILNLGVLYLKGLGVKQDVLKAINYFKLASKQNSSYALFNLGLLYFDGNDGIKQDYLKAKEYFEMSAKLNNSYALLYLANMYYNGYGIKREYIIALNYYELSAKFNNPEALFKLGCFYSDKEEFINLSKALEYFLKCFEIHYQSTLDNSNKNFEYSSYSIQYNYYCYRSANDAGLIYLIYLNDIKKATKYIKESAFGEYPYGQNNLGLLYQLYLDNIQEAEYFYTKSSKQKFCLAEFNLGLIKEKEGKINESIDFYIKASNHENEPLMFQKQNHYDERLEISKIFIMCLTDLKLTVYYLSKSKSDESKKYFIKIFEKIYLKTENSIYKFQIKIDKDTFSNLKSFILLYPLFNLKNQPYQNIQQYLTELNLSVHDSKEFQNSKTNNVTLMHEENEKINNFELKEFGIKIDNFESNKSINYNLFNKSKYDVDIIFTDPGDFFDFMIEDAKLLEKFINEIRNIINSMETILFMPPYPILFGRIDTNNPKFKSKSPIFYPYAKNINKDFYDGFN